MNISVFLAVLSALYLRSFACSCVQSSFKQTFDWAHTVIKARAISVEFDPFPSPPPCVLAQPPCLLLPPPFGRVVRFKLRLLRVYKGSGTARTFKGVSTTGCGGLVLAKRRVYYLPLGKPTTLHGEDDVYSIGNCAGNGDQLFSSLTGAQKRQLRRCSRLENGCAEWDEESSTSTIR